MPYLNSDVKGLEWRTLVESSGDELALNEILSGSDMHSDNQQRFGLPSRLIAKVFLFRWIYKGSAYAYSLDPDFSSIGGIDFWQKIINEADSKYTGMARYWDSLIAEAKKTGYVTQHFTGRKYGITPKYYRDWKGRDVIKWPEPDIVNFPIQGFGADIVALIRVTMADEIIKAGKVSDILPVLTVHDSLLHDCRTTLDCIWAAKKLDEICKQLPELWLKHYGIRLKVPQEMEHEIGVRYGWMHKIKTT